MTNEELEKAIEFIIDQEAKSSAKIDDLIETQKQGQRDADERWARADERWARTEESIRALLAIAELHEREITSHEREITSLVEQTRSTDDRLNVLVNVVEQLISERRNGTP